MVKIISVESNIGAGKSTIIEYIMKRKQTDNHIFILVEEPVNEWKNIKVNGKEILTAYYEDILNVALPFQLIALLTRKKLFDKKIKEANIIEQETGKEVFLITERTIYSDKYIFAEMLHNDGFINDAGMVAYNLWNSEFSKNFTVDKILYINISPEICLERILKRSRPGENNITIDYLEKCQKAHDLFYNNMISKNDNLTIDNVDIIPGTKEYDSLIDRIIEYFIKNENE